MKPMLICVFLCLACTLPMTSVADDSSPYAGQQRRDIKALSRDDIDGLLDGAGMGYARAAELNGYPGPRHVLDLAEALDLTREQRDRVQASFDAMQRSARALGRQYIDTETALERAFATGSVDGLSLAALTRDSALVEAQLRSAHLNAHLEMMDVLEPAQIARYLTLRGYDDQGAHDLVNGHPH